MGGNVEASDSNACDMKRSPACGSTAIEPRLARVQTMASGAGLFILVNANAKRGGRRLAVQIARALPSATVRLSRSIDEVDGFLHSALAAKTPPRCILSAGGDGSAIAMLGALDRVVPKDAPFPTVGALPLGTGNAWSHALGARKLDHCIRALARSDGPLPTRRYALFECDGVVTFFAGCGWDAQVLNDYRDQLATSPSSRVAKSVAGYLTAMATRTVPKTIVQGSPQVIIENLGDEAFSVRDDGVIERIAWARAGSILYSGSAGVAGAATCPEFGYGFRAFPFAERMLGLLNIRVYDVSPLTAVRAIPKLWRGTHPMRGTRDWFTTGVKMTFSRPVPLQIGGEACGPRNAIELKMSPRRVEALDWRMLGLD
jgi:diacylglycerol kinase family enzyme